MKPSTLAAIVTIGLVALSLAPGVVHAADPIAYVIVTPTAQGVTFGTTLQLAAQAYNASNLPVEDQPTFSYSTDLGAVSATGLYTATRVGTAHVTVSAAGFLATATLVVPGTPRLAVHVDAPSQTIASAAANGVTGKVIVTYAEDGSPIKDAPVSVLIQRGITVPDDKLPVKGLVPSFEQRAMTTDAAGEATFAASRLFTLPDHYTVVAVTSAGGHREAHTAYDVTPHP